MVKKMVLGRRRTHKVTEFNLQNLHKQQVRVQEIAPVGFRNYFLHLMRTSLIPGFPVLAMTRTKIRLFFKMLVFITCMLGFIYQIYCMQDLYTSYPTVIKKEVRITKDIPGPAVTVCNANRLKRRAYCAAIPKGCVKVASNKRDFCNLFPRYCHPEPPYNETFEVLNHLYIDYTNNSNEVLNNFGLTEKYDFLFDCTIARLTTSRKCRNVILVQASLVAYPYKCVTLESIKGEPLSTPLMMIPREEYWITLKLHPEEYYLYAVFPQVYVHIHDPRTVVNPFSEGVVLPAGFHYRFHVSVEEHIRLPAPFSTNCTDYMSMWKYNGGFGPMSRQDCIGLCLIDASVEKYGCVTQSITYPTDYQICNHPKNSITEEMLAECSQNCKEACNELVYTYTYNPDLELEKIKCAKVTEYCRYDEIGIAVTFDQMSITTYKEEAKYQFIELLSFIGSCTGLWLGISILSLISFAEMIFDVLTYLLMKLMKKIRRK